MLNLRIVKALVFFLFFLSVIQSFGQVGTPDLARYIVEGGNTTTGETTLLMTQFDDFGGVYCLSSNSRRLGPNQYSPYQLSLVKLSARQGVIWRKTFINGAFKSNFVSKFATIGVRGQNIIYSSVASDSVVYDSSGISVVRNIGAYRAYYLNYDLEGNFIRYGELKDSFFRPLQVAMSTDTTFCLGNSTFDVDEIVLYSISIKTGSLIWKNSINIDHQKSRAHCLLLNTNQLGLSNGTSGGVHLNFETLLADTLKVGRDTTLYIKGNNVVDYHWFSFDKNGRFEQAKKRKNNVSNYYSTKGEDKIYELVNAKNGEDLSLDSNAFLVSGISDTNLRQVLVKYDLEMKILGATIFESRLKNGATAAIGTLGDSTLLLFGRTFDTFDLDPSKSMVRINKHDKNDLREGFVLMMDTGLEYISHYKLDYKSNTFVNNFEILGTDGNQMILSANLLSGVLDIDLGIPVEKVIYKYETVAICAIYHLDSIGSIDTIAGPPKVCWSADSVFTYSVPAVKNAYWYDWDLPSGTQIVGKDSLRTIQVKFTKNFGTHKLKVTARRNSQNVQSKTLPIQTTNTQANYSFASGSSHICVGDSVLIRGNSTGVEYSHYLNGNLLRSDANPNFRADTLADGDLYFQIVRRSNGCLAQTKSVIFNVDTPIKPQIIVPNSLCQDAALNIRMLETDSFYIYQNQKRIYKGKKRTWPFYNYKAKDLFWGIGIDSNGCASPTDTQTILIYPLPQVLAGHDTSICLGDSMKLKGQGAISYRWTPAKVQDGDFVQPNTQSTYIVEGKGDKNCLAYDTIIVSIHALPNILARPDTAVCIGDSLPLYASGGLSYNWGNIGLNGKYFQPKIEAYFTVNGTDKNGCQNIDSFSVELEKLPSVYAGSDTKGCLGENVRIFANYANTYEWSDGKPNGHYHLITKNDTLWVKGTNSKGCSAIDSLFISAYPDPVFSRTADTAICPGHSVKLEAKGPHTFLWSDGILNGGLVNPIKAKTYFVSARDKTTNCSSEDSVQIFIYAKPEVHAGLDQEICLGDTIYPSASGASTYNWSHGNANNSAYQPEKSEEFIVIGTDSNGCTNNDTLKVKVHALPQPNLGGNQTMSRDDTLSFYPGRFEKYRWQNQSSDSLFGLNGREIDTGEYLVFVLVTDKNGCNNSDSVRITVGPSGREEVPSFGLSVYPNPAKNVIFIESQFPISSYKLFDLNGQKVGDGLLQNSIEVSHLSPGVYRIQVLGIDNISKSLSFVIQ